MIKDLARELQATFPDIAYSNWHIQEGQTTIQVTLDYQLGETSYRIQHPFAYDLWHDTPRHDVLLFVWVCFERIIDFHRRMASLEKYAQWTKEGIEKDSRFAHVACEAKLDKDLVIVYTDFVFDENTYIAHREITIPLEYALRENERDFVYRWVKRLGDDIQRENLLYAH